MRPASRDDPTDTPSPQVAAASLYARDRRLANLDLLRCLAIWMVLFFHVAAMWPAHAGTVPNAVSRITRTGHEGVDLFFVLSGWLIGGLFWREYKAFGSVEIPRFVLRRITRTVPPYLVALLAAWIGARWIYARPPAFDFGYLIFIQNYYRIQPYFQPSWSLCVEEHFYLVLPLLLTLVLRWCQSLHLFFLLAALAPLAVRNLFPAEQMRHPAATHLWLEGLTLGVWASYTRNLHPLTWPLVERLARWMLVPSLVYLLFNEQTPEAFRFHFGITLTALSCTFVLISVAERSPLPLASSRFVYLLAIWSYSLYLTHSLTINAVKVVTAHLPLPARMVYPILAFPLIVAVGAAFHYLFEASAIAARDRLIPRRGRLKNPSLESDPGI